MASESPPALADQVSRLYDLIAGYHMTHLLEIARELGVWEALVRSPGLGSEGLARELGTDPFYTDVLCRTAFSFGLLEREGPGWRMAAHFDQILGDPESSFYLARAPRAHMVLGEDYRDYVAHFRAGTTGCWTWAAAAAGRWCRSPSGSRGPPVSGSTSSPTRSSWPSG
jgi:Dimerisation domain